MSGQADSNVERAFMYVENAYTPREPVEVFMTRVLEPAIREVIEAQPAGAGTRVLDVGCGGQPFRSLVEARGHAYVSYDVVDPAGIVDHVGPLDGTLPDGLIADAPFDFVLCTEVLEHVLDWDAAFTNIARLTAPRGRVLITTPFVFILHGEPYDFWRATPHAIRQMAGRHGFDVVKIDRIGTPWDVLGTTLGSSLDAARARNTSAGARVAATAVNALNRLAFATLRRGWLQARVDVGNPRWPIYLANVALLERSAS